VKGKAEVEFQAYLGVCTECPENTVESIQAASEQGYNSVGIEINITSDGQFVLLCDDTVNRTARMPGGALIPREVSVRDITYEQALEYDFGIGFSRKFKGTAIPFLLDVLEFAAKSGIVISIGSSHERLSGDEREALFSILGDYGSRVRIVCRSLSLLEFAAKTLPKIGLCYEGEVDGEMLERIGRNIPKSRLSVRLDVNSAARELCEAVKKYALLELGEVNCTEALARAEALEADAVWTRGQIKPTVNEGITADMHTHSDHSHDCRVSLFDMREAQSKKGTDFVAVTNHSDVGFYKFREAFENIRRAADDAMELNARNDAFSRLLVGVEIGDGIHCVDMMRRVERLCDYDVIIGSVHSTLKDGELVAYSTRDFSCESDEEIDGFMMSYFADLKKTVELGDFDILAHLTCPLRYVIGRYGRRVDMEKHRGAITEILKLIIEKGIALELNTSSLSLVLGDFVPCKEILAEYRRLGGYLVTLGSDAHVVNEASANFDAAKEHLRELGFRDVYYFKKRRAYPCRLT